eukprot:825553-Rhodomonas_salina.2
MFSKLAKPCSSPDTWTESCGTDREMAQAQSLYKHAPGDAWSATGGMPVSLSARARLLLRTAA